MQTVTRLDPLRVEMKRLRGVDGSAGTVALVPTMGALHEGHLALVRAAQERAAHVVVSIFVNPRQFGANEDLDTYPRQLARDRELLEAVGVSLLWLPEHEAMYPRGYATNITVSGVSEDLDGIARPGHFDGVATVVCKLFNQVLPDLAVFGEKDWQQLAVIRRMARDLDLVRPGPDAIVGVPTVREADGLAMSSRNAYLSPQERTRAAALPRAIRDAITAIEQGGDPARTLAEAERSLIAAGFAKVDYVELRHAETLEPLTRATGAPARVFASARIGKAKLIDNMGLRY